MTIPSGPTPSDRTGGRAHHGAARLALSMRRALERARQEVRRLIAANTAGALHRALGDRDDDSEQHHRPPSPPPSLPTLRAPAPAPAPAPARERQAQRPVSADRLAA